jgi:hypothetical protein
MESLKAENALLREKLGSGDRGFDAGCAWASIVATQYGRRLKLSSPLGASW